MVVAFPSGPIERHPCTKKYKHVKFSCIRDCAIQWIFRVDRRDDDGRLIGFDYDYIRQQVRRAYPVVTYGGPYKGQPTKIPYRELQELVQAANREGIRLPLRPRRKTHGRAQ